ncbi:trypsin-like peptidase domain-containing protein [Candidatus Bathyarchaeota archaeon]|nr:trypsin-like peptidase domain-containing protein [Candidatus Bathyarchaeota archaeon]
MENTQKLGLKSFSIILLIALAITSLIVGGIAGYLIGNLYLSERISNLEHELSILKQQAANLQTMQTIINNTYILGENISLSDLYEKVKDSVVIIRGVMIQYDVFRRPYYTQVQGSGFVYNFSGQMVVITNYHVVQNAINLTVTFINGNGYAATVLGSDPYVDLAVLSVNAPPCEFKPLEIVSSSTLKVGDVVVAVGNPYGLAGSMSIGIVSALGRTITEEQTGGYLIANVIQTTAPLNPGNSGGPLLNPQGQVVGVTTAIVSGSQGLGFAIPSNTILREIADLVTMGYYNKHPWLGAAGVDMNYEIAKAMGINVTYGWLITQVANGGPADKAGLRGGTKRVTIDGETITVGGDIIIAVNGTRIIDADALSTYLEEETTPGQTINLTIVRESRILMVALTLGTRP